MQRARFDAIVRRPEEESARDAFPGDFPSRIDVPAARYVDPLFLELEKTHVFEKCWLFVAHVDQLPAAGDYLMLDALDRMGHPLFLLRGSDGEIRAFYNACRHRGGPLVDTPSGSAGKRLVCKYHAWTYDFEGRLVGFPEAKNFPHDAQDDCPALKQVACDTWGPFVFVRLSERGPTLREHLEPVASELDSVFGDGAVGVHFAARKQLDVACNWKSPGDGNVETYHVPFVHRNSAAGVLDEKRTGQWLLPRGHSRMLIRFRMELPAELPLPRFRGDTSLAELGIYSFHVFPNLSIVLGGPNFGLLITSFPDGVDRCTYYTHFVSSVPRTEETAASIDAFVAGNWTVLLSVCDEIMEPEYVVHISGWDLPRDSAYKPAVTGVFARFPGLQLQVHELVTNGDRLAMRFSEHGAASDADGRLAAWGGIGLYRWNGRKLLENFVEQDFLAQEEQLATGECAPLESPHLDPWVSTRAEPANAEAEALVRTWLDKGDLRNAASVVLDGSWYQGPVESPIEVETVEINALFSAGTRVAFHVSQRGRYRGGLAGVAPGLVGRVTTLRCVGLARLEAGAIRDVRVITDRLGARTELLRAAR